MNQAVIFPQLPLLVTSAGREEYSDLIVEYILFYHFVPTWVLCEIRQNFHSYSFCERSCHKLPQFPSISDLGGGESRESSGNLVALFLGASNLSVVQEKACMNKTSIYS